MWQNSYMNALISTLKSRSNYGKLMDLQYKSRISWHFSFDTQIISASVWSDLPSVWATLLILILCNFRFFIGVFIAIFCFISFLIFFLSCFNVLDVTFVLYIQCTDTNILFHSLYQVIFAFQNEKKEKTKNNSLASCGTKFIICVSLNFFLLIGYSNVHLAFSLNCCVKF